MNEERYKYGRYIPNDGGNESRWADQDEIKNAPTVRKICVADEDCKGGGLPIICDGRTAYVDDSDTHTLVFGSTGSKKTRLFVMPLINIFALADESFIVADPKGEIYQKTSGLVSEKGYNIIVLNFRELAASSFWNPLELIYESYHSGKRDEAISLLTDFISVLAEPQRATAKDRYFIELSCSMALAYFLFFVETAEPEEANIYNFANFFTAKSTPEAAEEISNCVTDRSIAAVNLKGVLTNKDARSTFGNVASGVSNMINPFIIRKALCQVLSKSSFDIRDIGKEKTAIYIIVPDEKNTLHFLITAFIKQTYEALINEAQQQNNKKLPVRVNIVLDEFGNIPAIPDMASMISAARSRNIRFFLMAQGMHQLRHKYEENVETIKGNCDNWVFLTSREFELLSQVSNLCGDISYNDTDGSVKYRPLISVSELQRLDKQKGEALIIHGRHYPFISELPDIDDYEFKTYPPPETKTGRKLPEIAPYDADKVLEDIRNQNRPMPFSAEVFGYEKLLDKPVKKDIFDW